MTSAADADERNLKMQGNVVCKNSLLLIEGTLFLTTKRLLFSAGGVTLDEDDDDDGNISEGSADFQRAALSPGVLSIPLESIDSAVGKRGVFRPSLTLIWHNPPNSPTITKTEFVQKQRSSADENTDQAESNINEWASIIEGLATEQTALIQSKFSLESSIEPDSLESKILGILDSTSWTGFFKIEGDLEEKEGKSIDPDLIDDALKKLVSEKLIAQDKFGMAFRKLNIPV